jgi:hypothetical protein
MKKLFLAIFILSLSFSSYGYEFGKNIPKDVKAQMVNDLEFIKSVQGDVVSPFHEKIFGKMDGQNYYNFFDSRVTYIGFDSCGGGNAVACVIPWRGSSKIWITNNYIKFSHPQIARLMVVYHETRHTETDNGNWPHSDCPVPFLDENGKDMKSIWTGAKLEGEPACDITPFGSYGSSTIMLKNISKTCKTCTEKVRMDARIYADDQFKRIIDKKAKQDMIQDFKALDYRFYVYYKNKIKYKKP